MTSAPIVNTYNSVHLWAQTVRRLETEDIPQVNRAVLYQSHLGPDGLIALDPTTRHMWQKDIVGHVEPNGQFQIVLNSDEKIRPEPYPLYRSRKRWDELAQQFSAKKRAL